MVKTKQTKKIPKTKKVLKVIKKKRQNKQQLDLCFLMDCTMSMRKWIEMCKSTLKQIITSVKDVKFRVAFVGYRDIRERHRFAIHEFSCDVDEIISFIGQISAQGGSDIPEDVQGGLQKVLELAWKKTAYKQVIMFCDAPGHGDDING